jgi:hypothetical protein
MRSSSMPPTLAVLISGPTRNTLPRLTAESYLLWYKRPQQLKQRKKKLKNLKRPADRDRILKSVTAGLKKEREMMTGKSLN